MPENGSLPGSPVYPSTVWYSARSTPAFHFTMLRLLTPLFLVACVSSSTITYLPSPEQPRLGLDEGRAMIARFIGLECDRLSAANLASRQVEVVVFTDSAGLARSAELRGSTGDERANGVIGAVAAQLDLGAPTAVRGGGTATSALNAGYSCGDAGVTATLERR